MIYLLFFPTTLSCISHPNSWCNKKLQKHTLKDLLSCKHVECTESQIHPYLIKFDPLENRWSPEPCIPLCIWVREEFNHFPSFKSTETVITLTVSHVLYLSNVIAARNGNAWVAHEIQASPILTPPLSQQRSLCTVQVQKHTFGMNITNGPLR